MEKRKANKGFLPDAGFQSSTQARGIGQRHQSLEGSISLPWRCIPEKEVLTTSIRLWRFEKSRLISPDIPFEQGICRNPPIPPF
jgi:hypothetical protein